MPIDCAWQCYCGSIIEFKGELGTEVRCRACHSIAVVTEQGARAVIPKNGHPETTEYRPFVMPYDGPTFKESHGADG